MIITAKVSEPLHDLNILTTNRYDKMAASKMSLKAWIFVLTQETRNPIGSNSSISTSRPPKGYIEFP